MSREELIKQLMPTFVIELEGHIQDLTDQLINLEKQDAASVSADNETLLLLQRTAHSLKGASRSVNLTLVEGCCHKIEDIIALALSKKAFSPAIFQLFFNCVDALEVTSANLKNQVEVPQAPLVAANLSLDAAVVALSTGSAVVAPAIEKRAIPLVVQARPETQVAPILTNVAGAIHLDEPASREENAAPVVPLALSPSSSLQSTVRVQADQLDRLMVDATEMLVENSQLTGQLRALEEIRVQLFNQLQILSGRRRRKGNFAASERTSRASRAGRDRFERVEAFNGTSEKQAGQVNNGDADVDEPEIEQIEAFKLDKIVRELDQIILAAATARRQSSQTIHSINDGVQQLRLVSFEEACQPLNRTVRDLAKSAGKNVNIEVIGGAVGIDRSIVDELRAPLLHLVRNAVDHGIEPDAVRVKSGKPPAIITLSAIIQGSTLTVSVSDNGAGLNAEAIREKALKVGIEKERVERDVHGVIFVPGFSTAQIITEVSGRGLGLDVVKSSIEKIGGQIEVSTETGKGTTFTLHMPTTLTTGRALLVGELGQTYALMVSSVIKVMRVDGDDLKRVDGNDMIEIDGNMVRIVSLRAMFGGETLPLNSGVKYQAILIAADKTQLVLLADKLLNEKEIVLKPLNERLRKLKLFIGTTILDDGTVSLILNAAELIRASSGNQSLAVATKRVEPGKKRIIVADDSITTRSMEKNILEAAGYEVTTASDGAQGWRLLQERGADLVVSDVEMPNMDGFAFAAAVRSSTKFKTLPFILVTALAKDSDKARGIEAGASAYLVKSEFEQDNLLEIIKQFL